MVLFSYLIELPLAVTESHQRAKQRCFYWCLCWCIERLNPEHPCSLTSHKLTNLCLTVQTPARIGTGFDILGSSHRACTTTLHKLAKFCTSLEMLANPHTNMQNIAKDCKTLHNLARIGAGVDILGGSPAIHRIDCAASGSLRLPLHFLLFGFFIFENSTYSLQFFARL